MKYTHPRTKLLFLMVLALSCTAMNAQEKLLNVAVVGMNHDHIHVLLNQYKQHKVNIIGIAEPDHELRKRFMEPFKLSEDIFYDDVKTMLSKVHPDAVLAYNPIAEHIDVAEACLPLKIPLMVEKPLATTVAQAQRMAQLSRENNTLVLTNYETTWYKSNQKLKQMAQDPSFGRISKMIAKDGHQGPKEIGCSQAFLSWLTDPVMNGAGALNDFGCYGANLMTWMMNGERPVAVTAITRQLKPEIYPKVDDDATILVEYQNGATGIIEASWNWSYNIKDFQVYGLTSSLHAAKGDELYKFEKFPAREQVSLDNEQYFPDQIAYLNALLQHKIDGNNDLSSLENNLIVVQILEAAKKSAQTGKRIVLE